MVVVAGGADDAVEPGGEVALVEATAVVEGADVLVAAPLPLVVLEERSEPPLLQPATKTRAPMPVTAIRPNVRWSDNGWPPLGAGAEILSASSVSEASPATSPAERRARTALRHGSEVGLHVARRCGCRHGMNLCRSCTTPAMLSPTSDESRPRR